MVYIVEANQRPDGEANILIPQLQLMMRRLWKIITVPSAILAIVFALWMLGIKPFLLTKSWMLIKLIFVGLLIVYHFKTFHIYKEILSERYRYTANFFRLWNEGATLILFAIVFLAILKDSINWVFGLIGLIGLAILLMLGIRLYKFYRNLKD
jgi:putative membrane protein